jgi:hypothetical protein
MPENENRPSTRCPYCGQEIEPYGPGAIYAVERREVEASGGREIVDGMGAWFHFDCRPESVGYERAPTPDLAE